MKFYRLNEIPTRGDDQVFKVSPTGPFIWSMVFLGMGVALLLLGIREMKMHGLKGPPVFFSYFGAAALGLFGWIALSQFRACLKPTNWLLRCNSSGVIIKYRSFLNWRFPAEDVQAVGFDYSEIAWVRKVREQRTSPSMSGDRATQRQTLTFLDFGLANPDTSALEAHLQLEQKARSQGRRIKTVVLDYPVEALPGGIVQLRWRGSGGFGISPSAGKAIEYLGRHVKIAPAESTKLDLTHRGNLSPAEADARILKLAKSGDRIAAAELTRQIYGSTLTEAVAFVEKLQSGG